MCVRGRKNLSLLPSRARLTRPLFEMATCIPLGTILELNGLALATLLLAKFGWEAWR